MQSYQVTVTLPADEYVAKETRTGPVNGDSAYHAAFIAGAEVFWANIQSVSPLVGAMLSASAELLITMLEEASVSVSE